MKNKYTIGQTIYKITGGKIQEYEILGSVRTMQSETSYALGVNTTFKTYYQLGFVNESTSIYLKSVSGDFVEEKYLFNSKEELIAAL